MIDTPLAGPRLKAASGRATSLVVLLHGYGAHGEDLIGLAAELAPHLPGTEFVAPNACEPLHFPGMLCFQWFPLIVRDRDEYRRGTGKAAPALQAFLDTELVRLSLPPGRLALVGFSQGTMMALQVGLRMSAPPAAVVGFSGRLAAPELLAAEITSRPPVLLIHGADDDVVTPDALIEARDTLAACGVGVEAHMRSGVGHEIDGVGLALAARFLEQKLGESVHAPDIGGTSGREA